MTDEIKTAIDAVSSQTWSVWFLIGAALVFWMQAGFAMVETGFTRAKNAGNIIMKNLMDFCIGTVVFIIIGASLLLGEDLLGFIGKPGFDIFTALILLCVLRSDLRFDLSDRSSLDLGRRLAFTDRIP